ncbi:hypothetical protein TSUD_219900 [Trifolium subterraneum]|uniref:Legume lectin domain-containing protein n=1 Tax=Trifolium subterraneum TaxID=3900 RepID=A0A2Z6PA55_TRISU|nr:hypothetical protein TSUD_219900 [Trifolium subterraneum]
MPTLVQFLISIFILLLLFVQVSSQVNQFLYAGFKDIGPNNLTLDGFAKIEKNGIIRLTNHTNNITGHAFYPLPFQLKNLTAGKAFSFSSSFALAVVPQYPNIGGHGMAFTIATTKNLKGLPIQYLGLFNSSNVGNFSNHLFAVEFDTVQDFGFDDINDNHVGIDINGLKSNASVIAGYYTDNDSTKQYFNIKSGKPILAWVDYDSSLNLLASSHYILGWSFRVNGPAPSLDLSSLPQLTQPKKKNASLIIGVSVTVACGRRPIEPKALQEELVLVDWVWERYKEGRILEVVDPKLNNFFDESEVVMVLKLGLVCSNDVPIIRPSMRHVMRILDGEVELPNDLRKPGVIDPQEGFDEFLNSLTYSSIDILSSSSYLETRDTNTCYTSFENSPQSLLNPRK